MVIPIDKIKTNEQARNIAINWQHSISKQRMSYGEIAEYQETFRKIGKRFGLLGEFKENGII
jgi:hypothetical protein